MAAALIMTLGLSSEAAESWRAHVSTDLNRIYDAASRPSSEGQSAAAVPSLSGTSRFDALHRVQIDIKYDCAFRGVAAQAKVAGLATGTDLSVNHICIVEGFASVRVLPTLASITGVVKIKLPTYPAARPKPTSGKVSIALIDKIMPLPKGTSQRPLAQGGGSPSIDGNGVTIMRADQFITQTGVNGSGASVAVMSDDVTSLALIQARGELPAVTVVTPTGGGTPSPSPTDEGTMMLEEVYAVAPGVTLLFCGPGTSVEYVSCLQNLITAGGSIVVDDLAWSGEDLMSADGDFAVMVQGVLTGDPFVDLFTVSENYNGSYLSRVNQLGRACCLT